MGREALNRGREMGRHTRTSSAIAAVALLLSWTAVAGHGRPIRPTTNGGGQVQSNEAISPLVDCVTRATRLDQAVCGDAEANRLATRVNELITLAVQRAKVPAAVSANQADWKRLLPNACARLDDPQSSSAMDLGDCLRLVLQHRIEVLEGGHLFRGEGLSAHGLPNPTGNLPTDHRRRYAYQVVSRSLQYFFERAGDYYLSNSEMVMTRVRGVFKLAYAGILPSFQDKNSQNRSGPERDLAGGRVYRVLTAAEVRAENPSIRRSDVPLGTGICGADVRWIIVNDFIDESIYFSEVTVHDYFDLMTRGYGLCSAAALYLKSDKP